MTQTKDSSVTLEGRRHRCGGAFHLLFEPADVRVRGGTVPVKRRLFRCDGCGEERFTLAQVTAARREAADAVREDEGLLAPAEIRALRERLGLSQNTLEHVLGLGTETVVRWEAGKVLQSRAADNLLRLVDRDRSALEYLTRRMAEASTVPLRG